MMKDRFQIAFDGSLQPQLGFATREDAERFKQENRSDLFRRCEYDVSIVDTQILKGSK